MLLNIQLHLTLQYVYKWKCWIGFGSTTTNYILAVILSTKILHLTGV